MTEQQQEQGQRLEVEIAGQRTVVRLDSFDGRDIKLCRDETGHAPRYWFSHQDEWDIDIIAMFVWLTRRRVKPQLTYDDVLESVTYDNFQVVQADADDEDDPEG